MVVNYDGLRASAALTGTRAYEDLAAALDAFGQPSGESRPPASFMGTGLRITWLIHDVTPWRVDAVTVNGTDVWVSTSVSHDGSNLFDAPAVWHRPKDADLLVGTLASMGVLDASKPGVTPQAAATVAQSPAARPATSQAQPGVTAGAPWWVAVAIGVAALGAGLLLGRARRPAAPAGVRAGWPAPAPTMGMPPPGASGRPGTDASEHRDDASRPSPVGFSSEGRPDGS
jgi:hypothetical protein